MSPSIHFPSPFRGRDLPPYGAADWKRLQPVLLRRSLALSSACAMLVGLALGLTLQHAAIPEVKPFTLDPTFDPLPPTFSPKPPDGGPKPPAVISDAKDGKILEADSTLADMPVISNEPAWPSVGTGEPNARVPEAGGGGWTDTFPDRPDPKQTVILDELPFPVYSPKPEYPELARQAGIEGTVHIKVLVDRQGKVVEVIHVTSSPIFDDSAEKALRTWRFRPALVGNHPVPAWVSVPVRFVMQ